MENLSVVDAAKKIQIYLQQKNFRPYFVISDDATNFNKLKKSLGKDFEQIFISEFCAEDFPPDTDLFIDKLNALETNALVFGVGEYIYFSGNEDFLRALQDRNFNHKVIFFVAELRICLKGSPPKIQNFASTIFAKLRAM